MAVIIEKLLIVFSVITATFIYNILSKVKDKSAENRLFCVFCMGSTIWSFCFGELLVQTDPFVAYVWRSIGIVGTFMSLIFSTILIAAISKMSLVPRRIICGLSLLGILIFPFNIRIDSTEFRLSEFGMSYEFVSDFWSNLYIIYSVFIAISMFVMIIFMLKKGNKKRTRKMGRHLLFCLIIISVGMVFDTVLPLFGIGAIPGSTITQFFGTVLMYRIICYYNSNKITIDNISNKIYYSVNAPTLVFDEGGVLKIVSNSAHKLLNIDNKKFNHMKLGDIFFLPEDVKKDIGNKYTFDSACRLNDRYCSIEINKILDNFGDEIGQIVAVNDLTEKNRIISQLEEERVRADQANVAKGQFLANMSHEIRTPINTVLGMNEMILRECEDTHIIQYSTNIHEAGEALLTIINDILDFSKIDSGMMDIVPEEYKLTDMIKSIISMLGIKAESKGLKIIYDIQADTPNILYGDEVRIRQIVTNLLSNAIKYTERGAVTLHIGWSMVEDKSVELSFDITDTGIGIREEDIDDLFVSFKRLDENRNKHIEGTGLGLNIVNQLVNLMEGQLKVTSVYGSGSTFSVKLRQGIMGNDVFGKVEDLIKQKEKQAKYKESFTAPEAKILIVDDNRMNLEVIRGLLKKTLIQAEYVMSGIECLAAVRHIKFDMIFLDHMMPMMDGVETLTKLKYQEENESRSAPVIALTANAIHGAKEQYIDLGFTDYMSKPIDSKRLEEMLIKYLPKELVSLTVDVDDAEEEDLSKAAGMLSAYLLPYGINTNSAFAFCKSLQMFTTCAKAFYNSADKMVKILMDFYDNVNEESWNNYRITSHAIKTNAKTLGNQELFEMAYMHEHRSARKDITYIMSTKDTFIALINKMCEGIAKYLIQEEVAENEGQAIQLPDDELNQRLTKIIDLLDLFEDEDSEKELKDILKYELDSEVREKIGEALDKLKLFQYQEAMDIITEIKQNV